MGEVALTWSLQSFLKKLPVGCKMQDLAVELTEIIVHLGLQTPGVGTVARELLLKGLKNCSALVSD